MILQYKNINVHFTDSGMGTALIFLHGFLENLTVWSNIVRPLSKKHRVICVDLLGHGQTECLGYIHTMEEMADAVWAVLSHLKLRKYILIGHSMGGYVALALAEKHPDHVKGLCLANSTTKNDSEERKKNRDRAIKAVKENHKLFISLSLSNLFAEYNRAKFDKEIEKLKEEALKMPLQGIIAALEGMKIRKDKEILFHFTPYKKILIVGQNDPIIPIQDALSQTAGTQVKLEVFPDGHMSFIENESKFLLSLMHFIENI